MGIVIGILITILFAYFGICAFLMAQGEKNERLREKENKESRT